MEAKGRPGLSHEPENERLFALRVADQVRRTGVIAAMTPARLVHCSNPEPNSASGNTCTCTLALDGRKWESPL